MAPTDQLLKPAADKSRPIPGAYLALGLLLAMNLFNYIDRQVLAAVEPEIRKSFFPGQDTEGPVARSESGLLASAFLVSYMLTAPLFGALAQRFAPWKLIAVGVTVWSLATGAGGLAVGFLMLLLTRCFVGVGEGAYGPLAPTILSDCFPVTQRGKVLSLFYVAMPVGAALGYALGGFMAHFNPAAIHAGLEHLLGSRLGGLVGRLDPTQESWRWAFFALVIPGLILGILALLMREPPTGAADAVKARRKMTWATTASSWKHLPSCSTRWA